METNSSPEPAGGTSSLLLHGGDNIYYHLQQLDGSSYRSGLPSLYLWLLALWSISTFFWVVVNARRGRSTATRHSQLNHLLWALASVPLVKVLQLGLSLLFWHSCFKLETCSLWVSFGVYVSGVLFQTASFVCFLLISLGYCITCERLSVKEQRKAASLGCVLYLSLTGYTAQVPYFTAFWLLNYSVAFYLIFHHLSQNLSALSEQLNLSLFEEHEMQGVMHTKYTMFKKFQGAMQIAAVVEVAIYINILGSAAGVDDVYWYRLLLREWARFCIFMYIGWIFRPQEVSPLFFVVPTLKCRREKVLPLVYSLEIDAAEFKGLASQPWQIGVPTSDHLPHNSRLSSGDSAFIIVQNPRPANS